MPPPSTTLLNPAALSAAAAAAERAPLAQYTRIWLPRPISVRSTRLRQPVDRDVLGAVEAAEHELEAAAHIEDDVNGTVLELGHADLSIESDYITIPLILDALGPSVKPFPPRPRRQPNPQESRPLRAA